MMLPKMGMMHGTLGSVDLGGVALADGDGIV